MESRSIYSCKTFFSHLIRLLHDPQFAAEELYGHIDNLELHVRTCVFSGVPLITNAQIIEGRFAS